MTKTTLRTELGRTENVGSNFSSIHAKPLGETFKPVSKFQVGKTYATRSICDHNCVFTFTVQKRSEKFVTLLWHSAKKVRRVGVRIDEKGEHCLPLGDYSMAPVLVAAEDMV